MYYVDEIMGTSWLPVWYNSILVVCFSLLQTPLSPGGEAGAAEHMAWVGCRLALASQAAGSAFFPPAPSPLPAALCLFVSPGQPGTQGQVLLTSFSCPGAVSFPRTVLMAGHTWDTPHLHASPAQSKIISKLLISWQQHNKPIIRELFGFWKLLYLKQ